MQSKHKYRVQVYLGKKLYKKIYEIAKSMQLPISTVVKLFVHTGLEFCVFISCIKELKEISNKK